MLRIVDHAAHRAHDRGERGESQDEKEGKRQNANQAYGVSDDTMWAAKGRAIGNEASCSPQRLEADAGWTAVMARLKSWACQLSQFVIQGMETLGGARVDCDDNSTADGF